jgi:hypothetical protein
LVGSFLGWLPAGEVGIWVAFCFVCHQVKWVFGGSFGMVARKWSGELGALLFGSQHVKGVLGALLVWLPAGEVGVWGLFCMVACEWDGDLGDSFGMVASGWSGDLGGSLLWLPASEVGILGGIFDLVTNGWGGILGGSLVWLPAGQVETTLACFPAGEVGIWGL